MYRPSPLHSVPNGYSRFDCVLNHWNYSEELNIQNNDLSTDPEPPSDGMDVLELREAEGMDPLCLTLEEAGLADDPDGPPEETGINQQYVPPPVFNSRLLEQSILHNQFTTSRILVDGWLNEADFLTMRYGLTDLSGHDAHGADQNFPAILGLLKGPSDLSIVDLYEAVINSNPLPRECDLSPEFVGTVGKFPDRSPNSVVQVRPFDDGFLLTVKTRPWRILIEDPLTLLQIEREGWHLHGDSLISNLVRKGVPFQMLYPSCQRGTVFYPHSGPVVHPDGKFPTPLDYFVYRLDMADFFKTYPHAHAAALCAGGILWRIAVDVLPLPNDYDIARPFHPIACTERIVDGRHYWTPTLTENEQQQIVGVYKWAGKPNNKNRRW